MDDTRCPLLLLEEEANKVSIGVHQVVFNGIKSTVKKCSIPDSQIRAAVKTSYQMEIDPLEENSDTFELVDRNIPFLRYFKVLNVLRDVFIVRVTGISEGQETSDSD